MKNKFAQKYIDEGLCDERGVAFAAKATRLPDENNRIILLTLFGTHLRVYKIDWHSNIQGLYYDVDLEKATDLKLRTTILFDLIKFKYNGETFSFTNCVWVKDHKTVLKEVFGKLQQNKTNS